MRTLIHLLLLAALGYSVAQGQVISEPDNVTVFEGREVVFTCVLNSSIASDDVQWYTFIKDTNYTTVVVDPNGTNIYFITDTIGNTTNSSLTITNVIESYTGYFWVGTPSLNVCNASLAVLAVISEPDNVTVFEGREAVFTCVLDGNISSDDVQWYRLIKDTSTTKMVDPSGTNISITTDTDENTTSLLTITNVIKSYNGYFWVGTPSLNVCNASLTVLAVISEPDDGIVFEGKETVFTCVLNSNVRSDDVQWYRFIKDNSTTVMVDPVGENIYFITDTIGNTTNSSLTITNIIKSYAGYFWVGIPSLNVCNASLTVLAVISEPGDVTECEGREAVFTCVLDSNIRSDDVQWYRFIKDTSTTEMVDPVGENINFTTDTIGNTTSSSLTITNVIKSYTGYFWVGTPSLNVCNVSLTVLTNPPSLKLSIMTNIESSSIVIQWDAVDDSHTTSYALTWFISARDSFTHRTVQTSYTINGLTLNTVYTITAFATNSCGTGPPLTTSVMLSANTTSTTSSIMITPTVTASTNPMTIVSTVYTTMINPSTTSTISMNPSTTSTISMNSSTTSTNSTITASIVTVINIAETTTTTVSNPVITISTNTLLLSTSLAETNMAIKNSDSSNIPIIAGAAIGGIIALTIVIVLILFIIFCCFQQRKDTEKNNYSDLSSDDTLTKGIPVALSPLNANDKSKVDSSHQISTATEGLYMTSDVGNKKPPPYKPIESVPQNGRKDTQHQQLMEYAIIDIGNKKKGDKQQNGGTDTKEQQPMEYAVVDKSKKKNRRGGKQQDVEAAYDDVVVPSDTDHTKANQSKNNPMLQYADLDILPLSASTRVIRDDSCTQYALVGET